MEFTYSPSDDPQPSRRASETPRALKQVVKMKRKEVKHLKKLLDDEERKSLELSNEKAHLLDLNRDQDKKIKDMQIIISELRTSQRTDNTDISQLEAELEKLKKDNDRLSQATTHTELMTFENRKMASELSDAKYEAQQLLEKMAQIQVVESQSRVLHEKGESDHVKHAQLLEMKLQKLRKKHTEEINVLKIQNEFLTEQKANLQIKLVESNNEKEDLLLAVSGKAPLEAKLEKTKKHLDDLLEIKTKLEIKLTEKAEMEAKLVQANQNFIQQNEQLHRELLQKFEEQKRLVAANATEVSLLKDDHRSATEKLENMYLVAVRSHEEHLLKTHEKESRCLWQVQQLKNTILQAINEHKILRGELSDTEQNVTEALMTLETNEAHSKDETLKLKSDLEKETALKMQLHNDKDAIKMELALLTNQLNELASLKFSYEEKCTRQISNLQEELDVTKDGLEELADSNEKLRDVQKALEASVALSWAEVQKLKMDLEEETALKTQHQKENDKMNMELTVFANQINEMTALKLSHEEECTQQIATLQENLEATKNELKLLRSVLVDVANGIALLKQEHGTALNVFKKTLFEQLDTQADATEKKIEELTMEKDNLAQLLLEATTCSQSSEAERAQCEQEYVNKIAVLQVEFEVTKMKLEEITTEKVNLEQRLSDSIIALETTEAEKAQCEQKYVNEIAILKVEFEATKTKLGELLTEKDNLAQSFSDSIVALETSEAEKTHREQEHAKEIIGVNIEIEAIKKKMEELTTEKNHLLQLFSDATIALQRSEAGKLQAEEAYANKLESIKKKCDELMREKDTLAEMLSTATVALKTSESGKYLHEKECEREIAKLINKLETYKKKLQELTSEKDNLAQMFQTSEAGKNHCEQEHANELKEMKIRLEKLTKKESDFAQRLSSATIALETSEAGWAQHAIESVELKVEIESTKKKMEALTTEKDNLVQKLVDATKALETSVAEKAQCKQEHINELHEVKRILEKLTTEKDDLLQQLSDLSIALQTSEAWKSECEKEYASKLETIEKKCNELTTENNNLVQRLSDTTTDIGLETSEAGKSHCEECTNQLVDLKAELEASKKKLEEVALEKENVVESFSDATNAWQASESEKVQREQDHKKELEEIKMKVEKLITEKDHLAQRLYDATIALETSRVGVFHLEKEYVNKLEEMKKKYDELMIEKDNLVRRLLDANIALETHQAAVSHHEVELVNKLEQTKKKCDQFTTEKDELVQRLLDANIALETSQAAVSHHEEELMNKLEQTKKKCDQLTTEKDDLVQRLLDANIALETSQAGVSHHEEEYVNKFEEITKKCDELTKEKDNLSQMLSDATIALEKGKSEKAHLEEEYHNKLEEIIKKCDELMTEKDNLAEMLSDSTTALEMSQAGKAHLQEEFTVLQENLQNEVNVRLQIEKRKECLESEKVEIESQNKLLQEQVNQLEKQMDDKSREVLSERNKVAEKQKQMGSLQIEMEKCKAVTKKQLTTLHQQYAEEMKLLQTSVQEKSQYYAEVSRKLKLTTAQLFNKDKENKELNEAVKKLQDSNMRCTDEVDQLNEILRGRLVENTALRKKIDKLQESLEELKQKTYTSKEIMDQSDLLRTTISSYGTPGDKKRAPPVAMTSFTCAEEDGQFMESSKHLQDLIAGRCNEHDNRLLELQRRNTLVPPQLRSSYPVETQGLRRITMSEKEIKSTPIPISPILTRSMLAANKRKVTTNCFQSPSPVNPNKRFKSRKEPSPQMSTIRKRLRTPLKSIFSFNITPSKKKEAAASKVNKRR